MYFLHMSFEEKTKHVFITVILKVMMCYHHAFHEGVKEFLALNTCIPHTTEHSVQAARVGTTV